MSTPSASPLVADARTIFSAAVRRVQADRLIEASKVRTWAPRSLTEYDAIRVAGVGKASMAMAGVLEARLPEQITDGIVVVPEGYRRTFPEGLPAPEEIGILEGGHPLPDQNSARAGRRLLDQARATGEGNLLLVLISGGGTALSSLPVDPLDLPDLKTAYHRLITGGVPIQPANVVRKHLTQVGGGQLARAAHPGDVGALVVSDVVGDDLATIASGPTVPDPSTFAEAMRVLYRYGLWHDVPAAVREHLTEGAHGNRPETPSSEHPCFERTCTTLLGSNEVALTAACRAAEECGYTVRAVTAGVEGEAKEVGRSHVQTMLEETVHEPTCWLWGGETTVTVTGDGTGGRNQEVALGAALKLEPPSSVDAVLLSGGTDGIDGPTDAAGAWATPETADEARAAGYDPEACLARNDAYSLFDAIDQLLRPGPTHTNVMDVHVGLLRP